ncbi:MAG: ABC transporter permease [Candidatus Pacearchaeota archaeon]
MIIDYFNLAFGNIKKRKLRSSLTLIGILISIATIFTLMSLSMGLNNAIKEQFRLLGTDKFFILPKGSQLGTAGGSGPVQLTEKDVEFIRNVQGVKDVSYIVVGNAKISFNNQIRYFMIIGVPTEKNKVFLETQLFNIDEGRFLETKDSGKIVVGSSYKSGNIFSKSVKINDKIFINDKEFKVVGILKTTGSSSDDKLIYMSFEDFKKMFNSEDRVDQIIIQIKTGEDIKKVSEQVKKKLLSFRGVTEKTKDFNILTPEELLSNIEIILNIITAFLVGIAGISLLVGSVGIANTMFTSVLERTKDIGVMKAIGAKNSDIMLIFVIESGLLGLIGGIIGVLLGIVFAKIIEIIAIRGLGSTLLKVIFPWYLIIGCLLFAFLVGALSGVFPARAAAKIKPADTLRYE